ncbi:loss of heterozygosity, 11, chromosomal region 2, gene A homolog (human), isoform CRA_a [Rattus norvegicus]|uniref:Loss of heterozygosity, 11, chromosomal region 2, gene A homolog (Human), isoform CRA_a n=1 Tax=Rattus norvegicus TaxID=10116 RepID=A6KUF6_RAT|nr:loss of heterozygosity, 11, chromosomal region 2, gene A homolog (human), isoform CRA_a [Rattus norvegicus]
MEHHWGLITGNKEKVPLKSISVTLSINDFVAAVAATLHYENEEKVPIEAMFVFPMDEDSAVYSFEALVDGKKIVAELQDKTKAHSKYEEALSQGHQAYLLEEDDYSRDVFSCNVGNLQPGTKVAVTLRYVQELPLESDGALRYLLPAVLNPRYQLSEQSASSCLNVQKPIVPLEALPYTLSMVATITSQHGIERVQSNCSLSPIQYLTDDKTSAQVSLTEGHKFDRDVELLIYYREVHSPSVAVEKGMQDKKRDSLMGAPCAMVSFYPDIPEVNASKVCGEFVFLMDRSGSMQTPMRTEENSQLRIEAAKLFVFTDGEVSDTYSVIREVKLNSKKHRCFSFGIGQGASTSLIKNIARVSGGTAEFITGKDRMQAKALGSLKLALQCALDDISLSWELPPGLSVNMLSPEQPTIFRGQRLIIYAQLTGPMPQAESRGAVCLKHTLQGKSLENKVAFSLQPKENANFTIHRLAAKFLIQTKDLGSHEVSKEEKKDVMNISLQSGVLSSFTAFVAINKELNKPVQGPLAHRVIPRPMIATSTSMFMRSCSRLTGPFKNSRLKRRLCAADYVPYGHESTVYSSMPSPAPIENQGVADSSNEKSNSQNEHKAFGENVVLQLIFLQNANGSWKLDENLTKILGTTLEDTKAANPSQHGDPSAWATILAVLWLHANGQDLKCEWELLERKAVAWLHDHAGSSIPMLVQAANSLLKLSVNPAVFDV